jgi:hypothetical protein
VQGSELHLSEARARFAEAQYEEQDYAALEGAAGERSETREQRLRRLQREAQQLLLELESEKNNKESNNNNNNSAEELRTLHRRLDAALLLLPGRTALDTVVPVKALAKPSLADDAVQAASSAMHQQHGTVRLELFAPLNAPASNSTATVAAADLERRLARLEATVGSAAALRAQLPLWEEVGRVQQALQQLQDTALTTSAAKLRECADAIAAVERQKRLAAAAAGGSSASAAASPAALAGPGSSLTAADVEELLSVAQRWDTVATALPVLVARLKALRSLHEDAARFSSALANVEAEQRALSELLRSGVTALKDVQAGFKENEAAMRANLLEIQKRVEANQSK